MSAASSGRASAALRAVAPGWTSKRARPSTLASRSAASTAARSSPVAATTATRSGLPFERAASAGTIIIAAISSGPRIVPITKALVRTRSMYSRLTIAQSLALTPPPGRGG